MDRPAILGALTDAQRAAIAETLEAAQLPPDAWAKIPAIRRVVATMAALNRLRHYERGGMTRELSIDLTAAELGLNASTIDSTTRRWAASAYARAGM